jgi:guanylate kinase
VESGEDEQTQQRRFAKAKTEMDQAHESGAYDEFVINDDLAIAQQQASELVTRFVEKKRSAGV